jgi:methionine-rich copper-binding protein CopC
MTPTPETQERIRQYLLGQLIDGAREELEQELLTNEQLFEELLVVEDEIIDEYLAGGLDHNQCVDIEQHFLSTPERQEKLRFARALKRHVTVASRPEKPAKFLPVSWGSRTTLYRAAAAFAVIAVIVATLWFVLNRRSSPPTFATLTLSISAGRRDQGVKASTVRLPPNADALRIILTLPNSTPPAARYRVELENDGGARGSLQTAAQDQQSVTVVIPSAELKPGQYSLKLFAVRADGREERIGGSYLFFAVE